MKTPKIGKVSVGDLTIPKIDMRSRKQRERDLQQVDDLTQNAEREIGIQLQKIKEFENKFKQEWKFDGDAGYYFSVCFRSQEERDNFLATHGITLRQQNHVMFEDIKDKFKEA